MISDEAVEAAAKAWTRIMCGCYDPEDVPDLHDELRIILKAAAPILLSHERQQTADAHRDAIVNRDTAGRLETALGRVEELAADWESQGEYDMAYSKTVPDEHISMALLTHGADMVENARHIRNAIAGSLP